MWPLGRGWKVYSPFIILDREDQNLSLVLWRYLFFMFCIDLLSPTNWRVSVKSVLGLENISSSQYYELNDAHFWFINNCHGEPAISFNITVFIPPNLNHPEPPIDIKLSLSSKYLVSYLAFLFLFSFQFLFSVEVVYRCFNEVADIMKVLRLYFDKSRKQRKSRLGGRRLKDNRKNYNLKLLNNFEFTISICNL